MCLEEFLEPNFHLLGSFIGKGDGKDMLRGNLFLIKKPGYAMGEGFGFSRTSPSEDKYWTIEGREGFSLLAVEIFFEGVHRDWRERLTVLL
jgi:hypothetical protein